MASWTKEKRILLLCLASFPPLSSKPFPLQIESAATCEEGYKGKAMKVYYLQSDIHGNTLSCLNKVIVVI